MRIVPTKADQAEIVRTRDKVDNITGPGVSHQLRSVLIDPLGGGRDPRIGLPVRFPARLENPQQDGSNFRWIYDFIELAKTSPGYGGWSDMENGRTGTAYNMAEDINGDESNPFGNGVNFDDLTGSFEIQPIPNNRPVMVEQIAVADGTTEWWFCEPNGVTGACA